VHRHSLGSFKEEPATMSTPKRKGQISESNINGTCKVRDQPKLEKEETRETALPKINEQTNGDIAVH
jgi:hypothetical protein